MWPRLELDRHRRFVSEALRLTRQRVAEAVEHFKAGISDDDEQHWLVACLTRELDNDARADPMHWPLGRLALSETELRVLWLLIAHELCPMTRHCLRQLSTEQEIDVSLDVLRRIVYGATPDPQGWYELSPGAPLVRYALIEAVEVPDAPSHRWTFRVARRVLALVHGQLAIDGELACLRPTASDVAREICVVDAAREALASAIAAGYPLTIVWGTVGSGRRSLVLHELDRARRKALAVDLRQLAVERPVAERQLRILARECRLFDRTPVLLHLDALMGRGDRPERLDLVDGVFDRAVIATSDRLVNRPWRSPPPQIQLSTLPGSELEILWKRALADASDADAALLANVYPLAPALVDAVGRAATAAAASKPVEPAHVSHGIRTVLDSRLSGLATRVVVTQEWKDLILPDDQTMAVREFLARIRARRQVYEQWGFAAKLGKGLGVTALFSGPPGTGKSMCAGLIAKDLGTEVFQVDLGKIVSKWLGETEKNLGALFDAAEAGHAVLLFDEADSLFGKRTAVTSSNDRYANQETNFLLQRLESFTGICILTTNHDPAIDEAFRRRLSLHVRFPVPDEDERSRLWRAMLPETAPVDPDLDIAPLAHKYVMGGGYIRNAVLRAAFLAADAGQSIGNRHLRQAAQLEYEAMGRLG